MTDRDDKRVAKALQGADFPTTQATMAEYAQTRGANAKTLQAIQSIPDRTYHRVAEVIDAIPKNPKATNPVAPTVPTRASRLPTNPERVHGRTPAVFSRKGEVLMRYDEFITQVRDAGGLDDRGHAEQATTATLDVLGRRLAGGELSDLAAQLPTELKGLLDSHTGPAETFDVDDFLRRIAAQEGRGCTPEPAAEHARRCCPR